MNARSLVTKTACAALVLLGISGCERPYQRFIPCGDNMNTALDTKTGQICLTWPKKDISEGAPAASFPRCYDLYKEPQ